MIFEYDRVSTDEQNPERQHIAIAEYAAANNIKIDRTYEDKSTVNACLIPLFFPDSLLISFITPSVGLFRIISSRTAN